MEPTVPVSITFVAVTPKTFYTAAFIAGAAVFVSYSVGKVVQARKDAQKTK